MADELRMALLELLCKAELERDTDFLREGVRALAEALMELEVSQHLGIWERRSMSGARSGGATGTATGSGSGTPGWERCR